MPKFIISKVISTSKFGWGFNHGLHAPDQETSFFFRMKGAPAAPIFINHENDKHRQVTKSNTRASAQTVDTASGQPTQARTQTPYKLLQVQHLQALRLQTTFVLLRNNTKHTNRRDHHPTSSLSINAPSLVFCETIQWPPTPGALPLWLAGCDCFASEEDTKTKYNKKLRTLPELVGSWG